MNQLYKAIAESNKEMDNRNKQINDTLGASMYSIDILDGKPEKIGDFEINKIRNNIKTILLEYENLSIRGIGSHYYKDNEIFDEQVDGSKKINCMGDEDITKEEKSALKKHLDTEMADIFEGLESETISEEVKENIIIFFQNIHKTIMKEEYKPLKI